MNELIERKLEEIYTSAIEVPNQVLEIFNDFFGEDNVDMQGLISVETFKSTIQDIMISRYIPQLCFFRLADYNRYKDNTLANFTDEAPPVILSVLDNTSARRNVNEMVFPLINIIVHFPHVRITNEYDRFVDINHLYAKVTITWDGRIIGKFTLNRSEYPYLHIYNNYMHSHVGSVPTCNFTEFQSPCTGQGPINDTVSSLQMGFDPDIWKLFCLELSKYVQVESISGVPYHRLTELGDFRNSRPIPQFRMVKYPSTFLPNGYKYMSHFISHLIQSKVLKFNYVNGNYSIGMPMKECIATISNEFIKWYNLTPEVKDDLDLSTINSYQIVRKCVIQNDRIYYEDYSSSSRRLLDRIRAYIGKKVCTFKGKDVTITIPDIDNFAIKKDAGYTILNTHDILYALSIILRTINYNYGKQGNQEGNRIGEKIRYI